MTPRRRSLIEKTLEPVASLPPELSVAIEDVRRVVQRLEREAASHHPPLPRLDDQSRALQRLQVFRGGGEGDRDGSLSSDTVASFTFASRRSIERLVPSARAWKTRSRGSI
jgi:hypothetical protein